MRPGSCSSDGPTCAMARVVGGSRCATARVDTLHKLHSYTHIYIQWHAPRQCFYMRPGSCNDPDSTCALARVTTLVLHAPRLVQRPWFHMRPSSCSLKHYREMLHEPALVSFCFFYFIPQSGILRPLANPETLKNLPMCNFEKPAYGNGHVFKIIWKNTPNTHPRGLGIWGTFPNYVESTSVSISRFYKTAHRQVFQSFRIC